MANVRMVRSSNIESFKMVHRPVPWVNRTDSLPRHECAGQQPGQNPMDHLAVHVGEALIDAVLVKGQLLEIEPEEVEDGGVKIPDRRGVLLGPAPELGGPENEGVLKEPHWFKSVSGPQWADRAPGNAARSRASASWGHPSSKTAGLQSVCIQCLRDACDYPACSARGFQDHGHAWNSRHASSRRLRRSRSLHRGCSV